MYDRTSREVRMAKDPGSGSKFGWSSLEILLAEIGWAVHGCVVSRKGCVGGLDIREDTCTRTSPEPGGGLCEPPAQTES